ncbi:n-alpha-acetyltransferase 40-like [Nannochloropsis oceanica]
MGAGKKARSKGRKARKVTVAAHREATIKALALSPEDMRSLGVFEADIGPCGAGATVPAPPDLSTLTIGSERLRENDQSGRAAVNSPIALVYHTRASLPTSWKELLFALFEANMEEQYKSNWGYREGEKRSEIFASESRYLVAVLPSSKMTQKEDGEQQQQQAQTQDSGTPVGFVHLRFVLDDDEDPPVAVLYVYEIQLAPSVQRQGLGARMMAVVEAMAVKLRMKKLKLTVFKSNKAALDFYEKKLGYVVDGTSPSRNRLLTECYEILSKEVIQAGKGGKP